MILSDPRSLIAIELKRRLNLAYPGITIYEGDGSVWGEWTRELVFIFMNKLKNAKVVKLVLKMFIQILCPFK